MTYNPAQEAVADIANDGGGTYYASTMLPCRPASGFAVGIGGAVLDARFVTAGSLKATAKRVAQEWNTSLVGTWLDGNVLYVDAVIIYADYRRDEAVKRAKEAQQQAIYDFGARKVITIEKENS